MREAAQICGYKLPIGFGKRPDDGLVFEIKWFDTTLFENEFKYKYNETLADIFKNSI